MSDKPSFLMRSWADVRSQFSRLGQRVRKSDDPIDRARYAELAALMRDASVAKRHREWWQLFEAAYIESRDKYKAHYSDKQAHDKAVIAAQEQTAEQVGKSVRSVRRALGLSKSDSPF